MRTPLRTTARSAAAALPVLAVVSVGGAGTALALVPSDVVVLDKVQICHANSNNKDPYVLNTPSADGDSSGHATHVGPVWTATLKAAHTSWGDIIPPYSYASGGGVLSFPGLNWTADGQAIWDNACVVPTPPVVDGPAPVDDSAPVDPAPVDPAPEDPAPEDPAPEGEPVDGTPDSSSGLGAPTTPVVVVPQLPAPPQVVVVSGPAAGDTAGAGAVTTDPTATPTDDPTEQPTGDPTDEPTEEATAAPTDEPTEVAVQTEQDGTSGEGPPQTFTGGGGELAFTGAPVTTYALLAGGLLGTGGVLLLVGRRRSAQ